MNRRQALASLRARLKAGEASVGSWMQIPHPSIAEILGRAGFDWVAVDMEHGSIGAHQLPDLFRALELGQTLPLVRLAQGSVKDCKQALDAGAVGVIVPMVEAAKQLEFVRSACCWPPAGTRGVGFSRANCFGIDFETYAEEAQSPLLVAMIENIRAVDALPGILSVPNLDAILIGPYDLSASMGKTAQFDDREFIAVMDRILEAASGYGIPCGIHVVKPEFAAVEQRLAEGYRFIAYAMDSTMLTSAINGLSLPGKPR